MLWIAHRGNTAGPKEELENRPEYLEAALSAGYDVETDVWLRNNAFYLGHDAPSHKIDRQFLRNKRIWTHCKNVAAFLELSKCPDINCFMQDRDEMALTTRGYLWANTYCTTLDDRTIIVDLNGDRAIKGTIPPEGPMPYGICSDHIGPVLQISKARPFDLLVIDIDGVMTDGRKSYDFAGRVVGKSYCDLDFTAIKRFKAAGIKVCFLSGDKNVNQAMAETRKVDFFHNPPGTDKIDFLPMLSQQYSTNRIAYVGDDYYDIAMMSAVNMSFCPQTSPMVVKRTAKFVVPVDAGHGVLAGIYDMLENVIPYAFPRDSRDVNP